MALSWIRFNLNCFRQLRLGFFKLDAFFDCVEFFEDCFIAVFTSGCCRSEEAVEFAAGGGVEAHTRCLLAVCDADEVIRFIIVGGQL